MSSLSGIVQGKDKVFFNEPYPLDHYAFEQEELESPKVISLMDYKGHKYAVYLVPTDARCYRSIARLTGLNTTNRDYTAEERIGLGLVVALLDDVYSRIMPIAQHALLGNNAHEFDISTGTTIIGCKKGPSYLHAHIWGRGNPEANYITGVQLGGPVPGIALDLLSRDVKKWKDGEMEVVSRALRAKVEEIQKEYESTGLTVKCN